MTHASSWVQTGGLLRVLGKLTDVIVRLFPIIFERLCRLGEVPNNWRNVNVVPIFKKGKREGLGYYRLVNHYPWKNDGVNLLGSNSCICEDSVCQF